MSERELIKFTDHWGFATVARFALAEETPEQMELAELFLKQSNNFGFPVTFPSVPETAPKPRLRFEMDRDTYIRYYVEGYTDADSEAEPEESQTLPSREPDESGPAVRMARNRSPQRS